MATIYEALCDACSDEEIVEILVKAIDGIYPIDAHEVSYKGMDKNYRYFTGKVDMMSLDAEFRVSRDSYASLYYRFRHEDEEEFSDWSHVTHFGSFGGR